VIGLSAVLVGTASAQGNGTITLDGVSVNVCNFSSISSITAFVNDNNPPLADNFTDAEVSSALGGSLVNFKRDRCGNNGDGGNHGCKSWEFWDGNSCERRDNNNGPIYNGPRYNSCQEYGTHNMRDFRRGDSRWNDSWDRNRNGIACDTGDVIVSNDGDCLTVREGVRNYGTRYNDTYRERLNRATSINSDGGRSVTDRERRDLLDTADLRDYRNRYNTDLGRLRTVCEDKTPPVIIVNEAPPAPSVTVTQAPPPPPAVGGSSSGGGSIPQGSVNTGGDSVSFTLAHNRAV